MGGVAGLLEGEEGGAVFVWGSLWWSWVSGDVIARRVAAVQLARSRVVKRVEVASAFGIDAATLWRWEREWQRSGVGGLVVAKPGPKGAWRVTPEVVARMRVLAEEGCSRAAIAREVGVSEFSVRRALGVLARERDTERAPEKAEVGLFGEADAGEVGEVEGGAVDGPEVGAGEGDAATADADEVGVAEVGGAEIDADEVGAGEGEEVEDGAADASDVDVAAVAELPAAPLPAPRTLERQAARYGALLEAAPVFTSGRELPLAGLLLALPTLQATGLLEAAEATFGTLKRGFYGLRSVLLTLVFLALVREPRAEALSRIVPSDLGRVLGLDRAPEVGTLRRKLGELAHTGKAGELLQALARHHASAHPDALGCLYIDGHVRVYHGKRDLPKTHVARMRISMSATLETWVCDQHGDPVFAVIAEPSASLVREIERLLPELRQLAGERSLTITFDRGGWSPALFARLVREGFDVLTYRKGKIEREPPEAFSPHTWVDERGTVNEWQLAERTITLALTGAAAKDHGSRALTLRQITRAIGEHQTTILSSNTTLSASELAGRMFLRWRQENYFRYAREHYALDALDTYASEPDDPKRSVPNPERKRLETQRRRLRQHLNDAEAAYGSAAHDNPEKRRRTVRGFKIAHTHLGDTIKRLRNEISELEQQLASTPARVPLEDLGRDERVLDRDTKLITHAARIAAYNTQSALTRALAPHYARAKHEGHDLIREALTSTGSIHATPTTLHVTLNPLATPRRTRGLASLCKHLNDTHTTYPGTTLTLHYSVTPHPNLA